MLNNRTATVEVPNHVFSSATLQTYCQNLFSSEKKQSEEKTTEKYKKHLNLAIFSTYFPSIDNYEECGQYFTRLKHRAFPGIHGYSSTIDIFSLSEEDT